MYPKLMHSRISKLIVLMTKKCEGTVLQADDSFKVGYSSTTWEMSCFEDFEGDFPELRYIFDGEKEIISTQNNNEPIKMDKR